MEAQMKRGFLEACVLAAVSGEESYGYRIVKDVPASMGALAITCGIGTASQLPTQALFAAVVAAAELAVARCALCGMAARRSSSTGR